MGDERCGFRCRCGFEIKGATKAEMDWISDEHLQLQHGAGAAE